MFAAPCSVQNTPDAYLNGAPSDLNKTEPCSANAKASSPDDREPVKGNQDALANSCQRETGRNVGEASSQQVLKPPARTAPRRVKQEDSEQLEKALPPHIGDKFIVQTDPLSPDSDKDGLTDVEEMLYGVDPLKPDTDDDELTDKEEMDAQTDPLNPDTDGDGLRDGKEAEMGTDPLTPNSYEVSSPLNREKIGEGNAHHSDVKTSGQSERGHPTDRVDRGRGGSDETLPSAAEPLAKIVHKRPFFIDYPGPRSDQGKSQPSGPKEQNAEKNIVGGGTGFAVTDNGHIVSNNHVIARAEFISVIDTQNRIVHPAEILKVDRNRDLALLKIDAKTKGLPILSTENLKKGSQVLTLGYPNIWIQGVEQKATFGHVNSLSGMNDDKTMFQVDTPIQPGNSEGPVLSSSGNVVGVIVMTLDQLETLKAVGSLPQNVNFAVKSDHLLPMLSGLKINESDGITGVSRPEIVEVSEQSVFLIITK